MNKVSLSFALILISILTLFSGCNNNEKSSLAANDNELMVGVFSYKEDCNYNKEDIARYGWFDLDFTNAKSTANLSVEDIIDLAKNETAVRCPKP
jgi:hypothetical protein